MFQRSGAFEFLSALPSHPACPSISPLQAPFYDSEEETKTSSRLAVKSQRMGWEGGKTLKLSRLTLTVFVQGAFVTFWCTGPVVLYTPILHRGHILRAHYTTLKTMTKIHYIQETFNRRGAGSICQVQ